MNTSEVLNKAADLIEERGWATGNCGMAIVGPMCLEGALAAVLGAPTDVYMFEKVAPNDLEKGQVFYGYTQELNDSHAYRALSAYLERAGDLYCWNDDQETAEQVVEVLRAAAVIEAAKETADSREQVSA